MEMYEFIALSIDEKSEHLTTCPCLAGREDGDYAIFLYSVGNFYAEAFVHQMDNIISRIRPFKTLALLDPYLSQIDPEV